MTDLRLLPSDPRYRDYAVLQHVLCTAVNRHCHYDAANEPVDAVLWNAVTLPELRRDVERAMGEIARTGRDS